MDLDIRLGYKESITLSREEFKRILEMGEEIAEDEVADLETEKEDLENEAESHEQIIKERENRIDELKGDFVRFLEKTHEILTEKIQEIKDEVENEY